MAITKEFLAANHADLVAEIRGEGFQAGRSEGLAVGAEAERSRILAVEAAAMPGCEALIAQLKADGKTSGPEAAAAVLVEYKKQNAGALDKLRADAGAMPKIEASASQSGQLVDPKQPAKDSAEAFDAAIAQGVAEKLSRGQAVARAARAMPEAHAAWIARANPPKAA